MYDIVDQKLAFCLRYGGNASFKCAMGYLKTQSLRRQLVCFCGVDKETSIFCAVQVKHAVDNYGFNRTLWGI